MENREIKKINFDGSYFFIDRKTKTLDVTFFYKNFLYRNIVLDTNHYDKKNITYSINKAIEEFKNSRKNIDQYFEDGGYRVTDSDIRIQSIRYIPQFAWRVVTQKGKIINDSTILINKIEFPQRTFLKNDSLYYHFIKTQRPDSLKGNRWKNKNWYWSA